MDDYVIDRTKCMIPLGNRLYHIRLTYGDKSWSVYASAESARQAKSLCEALYDYLGKSLKFLSVEEMDNEQFTEYDCTQMTIIGRKNILERRYRVDVDLCGW